jgi:hypothetical protein
MGKNEEHAGSVVATGARRGRGRSRRPLFGLLVARQDEAQVASK